VPTAVVDASVAVIWAVPDEKSELADAIFEQYSLGQLSFAAPTLWPYEIANALSRAVARGRITTDEGEGGLGMLLRLEVEWTGFEELVTRAWELALARGLTVYDASYIALAEARECDLYTCDARLAQAAGDLVPVHLLGGD